MSEDAKSKKPHDGSGDREAPTDAVGEAATRGEREPGAASRRTPTAEGGKPSGRRRLRLTAVVVLVAALLAVAAYGLYEIFSSDNETTETTVASGDIVVLPQFPSLLAVVEDGSLYVENDGNVTMSGVEVRDASGVTVCSLGTISPGDRQPCEEAGDGSEMTVTGTGPQGQVVEEVLE